MNLRFNDKVIAKGLKDIEEVQKAMDAYKKENGIKSDPYVRWVGIGNKKTMIDYGSHFNFFYVDEDMNKLWPEDDRRVGLENKPKMSRKDLFNVIKDNHLQGEIEKEFKKNFTNVSSEDLNNFINRNRNKIFSPKGIIEQRRDCNQKIIDALVSIMDKYPDLRFCQAMSIIGIDTLPFYEESQQTLWKVNSTMNKLGYGK